MISVIIPTCERPELLARCLDRLAPGIQTLSSLEYEVIVTDDGKSPVKELLEERILGNLGSAIVDRQPTETQERFMVVGSGLHSLMTIAFQMRRGWPGSILPFAAMLSCTKDKQSVRRGYTHAALSSPHKSEGAVCGLAILFERRTFERIGGFDENFPHPRKERCRPARRLVSMGLFVVFVPGAVIDHPPRRVSSGWRWRLAMNHLFITGIRVVERRRHRLLYERQCFRLFFISRCSINVDTFRAAYSMVIEFGAAMILLPFWEVKYRRRIH